MPLPPPAPAPVPLPAKAKGCNAEMGPQQPRGPPPPALLETGRGSAGKGQGLQHGAAIPIFNPLAALAAPRRPNGESNVKTNVASQPRWTPRVLAPRFNPLLSASAQRAHGKSSLVTNIALQRAEHARQRQQAILSSTRQETTTACGSSTVASSTHETHPSADSEIAELEAVARPR